MVAADTLNESTDELRRLLFLLDYTKEYCFVTFSDHVTSAIKETVKMKDVQIILDYWILHYFLPKEKALRFDIQ